MKSNSEEFSTSDFNPKSVYGRLQSIIGLGRGQRWCLAGAILLPIAVFSFVTLAEGCFGLGSVYTEGILNGWDCHLVGMSFVGDPMVWGFMVLVPTLIVVLKWATERTITLVNTVAAKASKAWKEDRAPDGLPLVVQNTTDIWTMQAAKPRWARRLLLYGPWMVAVVFWVYNTATCAFHTKLPRSFYPYNSERVKLITSTSSKSNVQDSVEKARCSTEDGLLCFNFEGNWRGTRLSQSHTVQTVALSKSIPLKKWDCQPRDAPLSCWLTRIWTLLYYGAIPFLVRHLVLLIWGATYFLNAGTRWEERKSDRQLQAVEINPFDPDGFGGLGALSDSVIAYLYGISCVAILVGLSFLKEGTQPSWHDYALMLIFLPFGIWGVLAPSLAVRHTIINAKTRCLGQLASELHTIGNSILNALPTGTLTKDLREEELDKQQNAVRALYDEVKRMSEWPFRAITLLRMIFPIAAPWLPAIIKEVGGAYIK
jgi:hypothetical protein